MAGFTEYPNNYSLFTSQQTKQINVVLNIEGLADSFAVQNTYTRVRYGDPDTYYGQPGLIYGALMTRSDVKPYLMFDSSLTLSQRLEPEQGRASISQFSFSLIDKDGYVSQVVSPGGGILSEILGRAVIVRVGYVQTSYPEDYFVVFRGIITNVQIVAGRVNLTLGDANQKRRSAIFKAAKAKLATAINAIDTHFLFTNTTNFYDLIVDESPLPFSSWTVKPYFKIENEVVPYGYGALSPPDVTALARGGIYARGTAAAAHPVGAEITNGVELTGHPIDVALKLMLSGWGGNGWKSGVLISALGTVYDPAVTPAKNVIVLPPGINADIDYGLVAGDRIEISGSAAGNDGLYTITAFGDSQGFPNRLIYLNADLNLESPSSATLKLYSQFDVYPESLGLKLTPNDVDVKTHIKYKTQVFTQAENYVSLYVTSQQTGKEFIEKECYLPIGAYSLTRYGRLSMGYTKPPLAADKLIVLDANNITNPQAISVTRGLNNRKFYNEIQYEYDKADAGNYQEVVRSFDTDSYNEIGILQLLPIAASGIKEQFGGGVLATRICNRMLSRFKKAAFDVKLTCFWNPGTFIEAGDGVVLRDGGYLKLTNFDDGTRNLKTQVFEVTDRQLDIKSGAVTLTLTSGLGVALNARYAVVSPSSQISATGTTTQNIRIKPSYGNLTDEWKKWSQLTGVYVEIHSRDYSVREVALLQSLNDSDPNTLVLSAPLSFTPGEDYIVDLAPYGSGIDPAYNQLAKTVYAFVDPSVSILSALDARHFTVSTSDFSKLQAGQLILVHNAAYTNLSSEMLIESVTAPDQVTLVTEIEFTPSAGDKMELIGFKDGGGAYRLL